MLVWVSSTVRPRATPMRVPSSAPTTTKSWPRRRSDLCTWPPSSNQPSVGCRPRRNANPKEPGAHRGRWARSIEQDACWATGRR
jgi:hypothetical protein